MLSHCEPRLPRIVWKINVFSIFCRKVVLLRFIRCILCFMYEQFIFSVILGRMLWNSPVDDTNPTRMITVRRELFLLIVSWISATISVIVWNVIFCICNWEISVLQNDFTGSPRQIAHTYRYQVCIVNRGGAAERASGELVGLPADYVLSLMDCQSPQS